MRRRGLRIADPFPLRNRAGQLEQRRENSGKETNEDFRNRLDGGGRACARLRRLYVYDAQKGSGHGSAAGGAQQAAQCPAAAAGGDRRTGRGRGAFLRGEPEPIRRPEISDESGVNYGQKTQKSQSEMRFGACLLSWIRVNIEGEKVARTCAF